jgi:hypothetical protein
MSEINRKSSFFRNSWNTRSTRRLGAFSGLHIHQTLADHRCAPVSSRVVHALVRLLSPLLPGQRACDGPRFGKSGLVFAKVQSHAIHVLQRKGSLPLQQSQRLVKPFHFFFFIFLRGFQQNQSIFSQFVLVIHGQRNDCNDESGSS